LKSVILQFLYFYLIVGYLWRGGLKLKVQDVFLFLILIGLVLTNFGMLLIPVHAQTWVEGHITQDTTWTTADSPYRAINDVIVDSGVLLTVEPGVEVQFADGFSLIVEGSMSAIGTEANPIIFTSSRTSPSPGAWETIQFIGGETEFFTIKHSIITYARSGVTINTHECTYNCRLTPTEYGKVLVEKNKIHQNSGSGIRVIGDTHSGTIITGNTIWSNLVGIDLSGTGDYDYFRNVVISDNTVSSNGESGINLYLSPDNDAGIDNVTISDNTVLSNGESGINLYNRWGGNIHNVTISDNTVLSNGESGINLYNTVFGDFYNVTISDNTISSNNPDGIHADINSDYKKTMINVFRNKISANEQRGIYCEGDIGANLTGNDISYNIYGAFFEDADNYWTQFNDIYSNTYGMNITYRATANAEYNYWGDATGPYHTSLNPEGKGNPVNGDGTDLDFIPFLTSPVGTINQRPLAKLEVDKTNIFLNETVTFDASASTDDGRIDYYFFDFGDGSDSGWTTLSVVTHEYPSDGEHNATLIVMDDFGVTSLDGELVSVEITVIPEFPSWIILPLFLIATLFALIIKKRYTR